MDRDLVSKLPDDLLTQILSYLPTKDSVTTGVLSKRWESLWLKVPGLDLMFGQVPGCPAIFVDNFLEVNEKSQMQRFKIMFDEYNFDLDRFMEWIGTTIDRGIQHLDVECFQPYFCIREVMPENMYRSNTLVSLKLTAVEIEPPEVDVSLPCLKIMHLESIWFSGPLIMEDLILGCPVLEDLTLIRLYNCCQDVTMFLYVRSQTLKRFRYRLEDYMDGTGILVEVDAPRLEYLSFNDNQSESIVLKNLTSLSMIEIDTDFNIDEGSTLEDQKDLRKRDIIRDFLTGVSSVRHMIISEPTLEVLELYSKLRPVPKFNNLYSLEAAFSSFTLQFLPVFLDSCPNLKNLIVDFEASKEAEAEGVELSDVPRCLLSTLECVEIKNLIKWELTGMEVVIYLSMNSAVLKKLSLSFIGSFTTNEELNSYKYLVTSLQRSGRCQVFIY